MSSATPRRRRAAGDVPDRCYRALAERHQKITAAAAISEEAPAKAVAGPAGRVQQAETSPPRRVRDHLQKAALAAAGTCRETDEIVPASLAFGTLRYSQACTAIEAGAQGKRPMAQDEGSEEEIAARAHKSRESARGARSAALTLAREPLAKGACGTFRLAGRALDAAHHCCRNAAALAAAGRVPEAKAILANARALADGAMSLAVRAETRRDQE